MKSTRTLTKSSSFQSQNQSGSRETEVEVLYQKLGNRWYAFSLIDDEVFVGSISQNDIDQAEQNKSKIKKVIGNS